MGEWSVQGEFVFGSLGQCERICFVAPDFRTCIAVKAHFHLPKKERKRNKKGSGLICGLVGVAALSAGPGRQRLLQKGACGTAVASVAEDFDLGWTTGEC